MKNRKKRAAMMMAVVVAGTLLFGCGKQAENGGQKSGSGTGKGTAEVSEVIFRFGNYGPTITDLKKVEDAMNEILIPKINCRIKLEAVEGANYNNQMNLDLSSGTRVDAALTAGSYNTAIAQNQIVDITDYLNEYGQGAIKEIGDKYLKGVTVNGRIYGLPNVNGRAAVVQFAARTDILEKYDLSLDGISQQPEWESQAKNLELISSILKTVKENEPGLIPLVADQVGNVRTDELITKNSLGDDLGVLLGRDSTQVVNYYAAEEFKNCCYLLRDWYQKGYIMKDVSTTTESSTSIMAAGKGFSIFTNSEIGYDAQMKNNTGYDFTSVKMGVPYVTGVNGRTYSVPVTAKNPAASVKVLNELYSNPDIATLLVFGIKDVHYVLTEDGKATYPEGVDANTAAYHHSNFWAVPNQLVALDMAGTIPDYNKTLMANNQTAETAKTLGFTFDNSSVQTETAACTAVVDEYKKGLKSGSIDVDKNLPEFLQKLTDAGIDTIIQEKQKQLDQWLKENGVN